MKSILLSLITLVAAVALAQADMETVPQPPIPQPPQTIWVQGTGSSFGQCDGSGNSNFCVSLLKQRSEQSGRMNAQNQCFMQGGQAIGYASCYTYCNPAFIQPGSPMQMVNCHSNCSGPCQIRNFE